MRTFLSLLSAWAVLCTQPIQDTAPQQSSTGSSFLSQPIQIITQSADDPLRLDVVDSSLKLLDKIRTPVSLVSATGSFKFGKSTLLNALANKLGSGFGVGASIHATTAGLWLLDWGETAADGSHIILMDTQGLFDQRASEKLDAKIFAVSVLLSSHMLFNTFKSLNQLDVDALELLAQRTRLSQSTASDGGVGGLPTSKQQTNLTWVVRDFMENFDGLSCDEWLQQFLQNNYNSDQQNTPKQSALKHMFGHVTCHTIAPPHYDRDVLKDLTSVPRDNLNPQFFSDIDKLRNEIKQNTNTLSIGGTEMDGPALVSLIRLVVDLVNSDYFLGIPSLWQLWGEQIIHDVYHRSSEKLETELQNLLQKPPQNTTEFDGLVDGLVENSNKKFSVAVVGFPQLKIQENWDSFCRRAAESIKDRNQANINEMIGSVFQSLRVIAEKKLSQVALPASTQSLEAHSETVSHEFEQTARNELAAYSLSRKFERQLNDNLGALRAHFARLTLENESRIRDAISQASAANLAKWKEEVNSREVDNCLSTEAIAQWKHQVEEAATQTFANTLERIASFLPSIEEAKQALVSATAEGNSEFSQFIERSNARANEILDKLGSQLVSAFDKHLNEFAPFPAKPDVLEAAFAQQITNLIEDFKARLPHMQECAATAAYLSSLSETLATAKNRRIAEAVAQIESISQTAFNCIEQQLPNANGKLSLSDAKFIALATQCLNQDSVAVELHDEIKSIWQKRADFAPATQGTPGGTSMWVMGGVSTAVAAVGAFLFLR